MTVGMYEDGTPGELFITMAKEGSVVSGLMDSFATAISLALQYGVPLQVLVRQVQPHPLRAVGFTGNPDIPIAKSITDYIFRWLALKFLPSEEGVAAAPPTMTPGESPSASAAAGQTVRGEAAPAPPDAERRERQPTSPTPTRRPAPPAARSPCAAAPATSA